MGYRDAEGNWIEVFRSTPYPTRKDAENKIAAVVQFHVTESGWELTADPYIEETNEGFVAVIPLKKPAEKGRH